MNFQEVLIIVIIGLVLFNWRKLPQMGGGIGKAISNFKRSLNEPEEIDITEKKKDSGEHPPKP
ncbi:MAG: twin-arginine translocase TatA/TatE family subunit [Proteobacteria bacterium]|nr:twin-arginine translocase TatA/TatE family subunit [Pseudomonadota bacterium]MBU1596320.1 twin-arginine translocase TatA/TatE family subunit [Pseudomonadota bacterium]